MILLTALATPQATTLMNPAISLRTHPGALRVALVVGIQRALLVTLGMAVQGVVLRDLPIAPAAAQGTLLKGPAVSLTVAQRGTLVAHPVAQQADAIARSASVLTPLVCEQSHRCFCLYMCLFLQGQFLWA